MYHICSLFQDKKEQKGNICLKFIRTFRPESDGGQEKALF